LATPRITGDAYQDKARKTWYYQISIPAESTPDRRRYQIKKRGFPTKREALAEMDHRIREIRAGKIAYSGSMTFAEFVDNWYEEMDGEIPDQRRAEYRYQLRTYALPWLGDVRLSEVAGRLKNHYKLLLRAGKHRLCCYRYQDPAKRGNPATCKQGQPLSRTTVNLLHTIVHGVLSYAVEKDLFPVDEQGDPYSARSEHCRLPVSRTRSGSRPSRACSGTRPTA
jgi:hypothetical protein